ncbi:MAG TPA: MFS transporter [Candidatus Dormibacteraeota bacterium]|nr:MFS transporter [Candidatus Dormibacteraeota bacterium]
MSDVLLALRNRGLVTLMLGHFTVDNYVGLIPVLYPFLIHRFHVDLATVGLVSLAYGGTASLSQPFFGVLADRFGTRLTGLALVWTASTFALVGLVPTFWLLVAMAAISGLGSGAFHPFGAMTVRGLLPRRGANTAMSVYVTGGTVGVAVGPLIGVLVLGAFGDRGTAAVAPLGLAIAVYLLLAMRPGRGLPHGSSPAVPLRSIPLLPLAATVATMASRNWTVMTLQAYTPTWYHLLGYPPWFYGPLATTLVLASALGTVGCGAIADRHGRKAVILASLVLSVPAVWLFVAIPGPLGFLWAILVGGLAASTAPLTLMMAQELMRGRAGLATGLILGPAFVTGAVGVPVTGALADRLGLGMALMLQVAVVAATIPIALRLPGERFLRELQAAAGVRDDPALVPDPPRP